MADSPARVYAVTSGKGGVGKTHTTVNLGLALVKQGKRVLLLDADLGLANINILLGFEPGANVQQVLTGEKSLRDVIVSHSAGFDIIPASSGIPELTSLSEGERMQLISAIDELALDYDYMFVDTAAGIGDNVLYFNLAAEEIIVVIDQEPTSITDAYALIKVLATRHGRKNFKIIVNRLPYGVDGRTVYSQLASATDKFLSVSLKYLGSVSEDESVIHAVVSRKPYFELYPSTKASLDISQIAKRVAVEESARTAQGGMQFFFRSILESS